MPATIAIVPSFLLCSPPVHGHVTPVIELGRGLVERGDAVTVLTGRRYEDAVLRSGLAFAPLPAEVDFDDSDLDAWLPGRGEAKGLAAVRQDMIGMFARVLPGQWRAVAALLASQRFDGIVGDATFTGLAPYASRPAAERLPVVGVSPVPVVLTSVDTGPFGLALSPARSVVGRLRNRALNAFVLRGPLGPIGVAVDEALAEVGEPPATMPFSDYPYRSYDRLFQLSIAELEYPRRELPDTVRFVGPLRRRKGVRADGLPAWWGDLDSGRPVVHVSQGTMDNHDLGRLVVPTLRALADEDVLVVVATGGRPVDEVVRAVGGRLPSNARVEEYLPYDELLPRCDAFVTNGGFGGVQRALAAGVPLVVAGSTEDKPEIAARVQWAGCGIDLRTGTPTPERVRAAVRRVLGEESLCRRTAVLRDRMDALPDPVDIVRDALIELAAAGSAGDANGPSRLPNERPSVSLRTLPIADVQQIEQAEADYFLRFLAGASAPDREALGIRTARYGGATAAAMAGDPTGYWSKSIGLGFDVPLDRAVLTDVLAFFRASGRQSALVAVAPQVLPDDWDAVCAELGLTASPSWAKFACPVDEFVPGETDLDVRELTAHDTAAWARIIREAFGMTDPDLTPMLRGVFDDPEARVFGAWDGDELVGAGAVHVVGEVASINTGGTLPSHRNRGVQAAILTARHAAAVEAGCRLLAAETGLSTSNPSYRNLVRSGFTHHYDRTNWLWNA